MTWPLRCFAHDRQDRAGDVERAEEVRLHLPAVLLGADLLEESGVEVARVVDEHVDAAESLHGRLGRSFGGILVGDVERDGEKVVVLADGVAHAVGIAAGRDDRVSGGECRLRDLDAHAAAGAGDEPHRVVSHVPVCLSLR